MGKKKTEPKKARKSASDKKAEFELLKGKEAEEVLKRKDEETPGATGSTTNSDDDKLLDFSDGQPYDGNVRNKGYNQSNVEIKNAPDGEIIIPEQDIIPPVIDFKAELDKKNAAQSQPQKPAQTNQTGGHGVPPKTEQSPSGSPSGPAPAPAKRQPDDHEPTDAEAREGARRLADMVIEGYAWLKTQGYKFLNINQQSLEKKALKGKIDMDVLFVEIPVSATHSVSIAQILNDYTRNLQESFSINPETEKCNLPDEWVNDVRPALIKLFVKKKWGASAEQYVLFKFGMDALQSFGHAIDLNRNMNYILKNYSRQLWDQRGGKNPAPATGNMNVRAEDIRPPEPAKQQPASKETTIPSEEIKVGGNGQVSKVKTDAELIDESKEV